MQEIWVFTVLALASADVSHLGYHYKVPHTSYGVPSYQVGGSSSHYSSGLGSSGPGIYKGAEGQYLGSSFSHGDQGVPSHLTGDAQLAASTLNGGFATGLGNGFGSGLIGGSEYSSGPYFQTVGGPSTVQPIYLGASNQYSASNTHYQAAEKYQQYYQVQSNEPAQVYKHFYVHSAPEELELPKPRTPIVLPPPQKHYKIIFVKTPSPVSHSSQILPVQPQNEEKTIVYVLVKKPEEHREVIVPKVEQKPPTKPEVYFIKYNNKEDSQAVINNIVNDYNKPGQSVSFATGGSEGSPIYSGLPFSGSGYITANSGLSDVPSFAGIPSGGFSSGFSDGLSSNFDSTFSAVPSSVGSSFSGVPSGLSTGSSFSGVPSSFSTGSSYSGVPSSLSTGSSFSGVPSSLSTGSSFSNAPSSLSTGSTLTKFPSTSLFSSSTGSNSGLSNVPSSLSTGSSFSGVPSSLSTGSSFSGAPSSLSTGSTFSKFPSTSQFGSSTGSNSGLSSDSGSSSSSGSSLTSIFGNPQTNSSASKVSSSSSSQLFGTITSDSNDSGTEVSSVFGSVSSPLVSSSTSGQNDLNKVSGTQGLPHETYGVPKFRTV